MTQQHTPGPWIIEDPTGPDISILARCDQPEKYRRYIAHLTIELNDPNDIPADEVMANARLIAYAPDILVALKEAEELLNDHYADIDNNGNANGAMRLAMELRQIIAKATGEEK